MSEQLARQFHEIYERLAQSFGYETRTETRAFEPTTPNGRLMIAVTDEIEAAIQQRVAELTAELARRDEELALTEKKLCNIDRSARAEIARRDELIKHKEEVIGHIKQKKKTVFELLSNTIKRRNKKIAEQADTIRKLKEDAERLASTYVIEVFPHEWVCRGGCHHWARFGEQIDHAPDCPVALHRALMKELE